MKRGIIILTSFFSLILSVFSQNELYLKKEFVYKSDTLPYRVLFPEDYDKSKAYPLVVFLHGAGERGNDNESQLLHGSWLFTKEENRNNFPCIVLFPQCPADEYWAPIVSHENGFSYDNPKQPTKPLTLVKRLIYSYEKQEAVDSKRIYIMGISMGGMGTFDMICRYPRKFAAAISICGGVSLERLKKARNMPIRIYHGSADVVVSVEHSRDAFIELKADGSDKVEYIEYPGVGHDCWSNAFNEADFLKWLFEQKR